MKVYIDTEIKVSIPEHQVLLSFNDDEDAVIFNEWWDKVGSLGFLEYIQNLPE